MSHISYHNSYTSGLFAEFLARWYLRFHGFSIVKSRYITGRGTNRAEIDIIAKRRNLLVFIEVKRRKSIQIAFDAITQAQALRLRRARDTFLMQNHWNGDARFDVITVVGWHVYHFQNAI
jgi:putative endonuclease